MAAAFATEMSWRRRNSGTSFEGENRCLQVKPRRRRECSIQPSTSLRIIDVDMFSGEIVKEAHMSTSGLNFVQEYWTDAWQRSILTLDVLRERGNTALERSAAVAPNVLHFEFEVVLDGRTLAKPVNYALVRIVPPAGTVIDPSKAPFIVFDPRAGHGPGIGGMK